MATLSPIKYSAIQMKVIGGGRGGELWHMWELREMRLGCFGGIPKARDNLKDLGLDRSILLKWIVRVAWEAWTGFIWLRMGTSDGLV